MRYCTRANIHVDRIASAWLIHRFLDPDAEFVYLSEPYSIPDGAIPFDMFGVEWGHRGNNCTFETILEIHRLEDPVLSEIARIVHGADIVGDEDETLESAGVDLVLRGLRMVSVSDEEALQRGSIVMDGLYAALSASSRE